MDIVANNEHSIINSRCVEYLRIQLLPQFEHSGYAAEAALTLLQHFLLNCWSFNLVILSVTDEACLRSGICLYCLYSLLYNSDCSGITRGSVLNGELCAQRLQKLIYLHLFTDCFMKISL